MSNETKKTIDETLEDLFADSSTKESLSITLPSRGIGYSSTKSKLSIKALTFDDEKALATIKNKDTLDILIDRCVVGDIDPEELYLEDKLFLYYKIRECSFGSTLKTTGKCMSCGQTNDLELDLGDLPITYAEDTFTNPKEIKLPKLGKVVKVKKATSGNSVYTNNRETLLDNLWRFVTDIGGHKNPKLIAKAIKLLSGADIRVIIDSVQATEFGIETGVRYVCNKCNYDNEVQVGITPDFFTVS